MMAWLLALLALEPPMVPEAKRHLDAGLRAYDVQDYARAIEEFRAGYELDPQREFLYALGQAQRMKGDCDGAIRSYEAFLRTDPPERQAAPARQNIMRCRDEVAAHAPPPAAAPPAAPPPEPVAPTPALVVRTEPHPWYADALGGALVGGGVAALVIGGLVWSGANDDIAAANAAPTYPQFAAHADGAETRQTLGVVTMVAGGALVAGGIVRYWLRPQRVQVTPMAGLGLVVAGRF